MSLVSDMIMKDAAAEDEQRLADINKRWQAYYGKIAKPLKVKPGQIDDNLRLNFAGGVVNEGVAFLFGHDIDFVVGANTTIGEAEGNPHQAADDWLEACWKKNKGMTLLQELAINGGVAGHAYLKVIEPGTVQNQAPYPRLVLVDPATISALWDPHDYKMVLKWTIAWHGVNPDTGRPIAFRQLITKDAGGASWTIVDQHSDERSSVWTTDDTALWPYAWSPVFHCQNLPAPNQFYGMADLEDDVIEAAAAINFTASNIGRILRFHAHPKTWGTGFQAAQLDVAVDGTIILPSKDATLQNLEMQSDLSSSLEFYKRMLEAFYAVSRTPEITTGNVGEGLGSLSGLALQVLYGPLVRKNGTKQRLYGDMLTDLSARLLEMSGQGADLDVSISWPNPLPADPVAERTALQTDTAMGVASKATVAEKLGYNWNHENDRIQQETKDAQALLPETKGAQAPGTQNNGTQEAGNSTGKSSTP